MEQESIYKHIAVIGCGAAGGLVSILLAKNPSLKVYAFDKNEPFTTLIPTGGGRCNITYNEDDIRSFCENYPRGNKFLLSVFSKFNQSQTRKLFNDLGIKTYVQPDNRVFPETDSSKRTVLKLREHLISDNFKHINEKVISVMKKTHVFEVKTDENIYAFDAVIVATGGRNGYEIAESFGHKIIEPRPSLASLDVKERSFYNLSGVSLKDTKINAVYNGKKYTAEGDFLFTHKSVSGPCVFKISALSAYDNFSFENPLELTLTVNDISADEVDTMLADNYKKSIKNLFSKYAPESYITEILRINNIDAAKQCAQLKKSEKEIIINSIRALKLHAISRIKDSEIVTAGGIDLDEVNSKTMESKLVKDLYFIGEVLNIDGFTGGFNLQNCWSTAYICSLNF